MTEYNTPIYISLLGGFKLRCGDCTVSEQDNRSNQLWRILEYLLAFRNREIAQAEMLEAFWPDDQSDDPSNALKNLIYRVRLLLTKAGIPHAKDIIILRSGRYCWNNSIPTTVDSEEFERLLTLAADEMQGDEARVSNYLEALGLYRGDFLGSLACEVWAAPLTAYFHGQYLRAVYRASALLQEMGRHDKIAEICRAAILIDQYDEGIHATFIRALAQLQKPQLVIEHYQRVVTMFYNELGVKPSEELTNLYREIVKDVRHTETSLDAIKQELVEDNSEQGAFVCEYEIFKDIYRLLARSAARNGQAVFLGLITASAMDGGSLTPKEIAKGMDLLLASIHATLRRGDTVARIGPTQYILMLPSLTFENGQMVLHRILQHFRRQNPRSTMVLSSNLQPIDPITD